MFRNSAFALVAHLACTGVAFCSDISVPLSGYEAQAEDARALLRKAVKAYREQGDRILPQLSRQGIFTTATSYVYVINHQGVMLASGGPSAIYIGRDIRPMLEDDLRTALNRALYSASESEPHSAEYHWINWSGQRERKQVYFQRVGDKIIAAGYYVPRSTLHEAQQLLSDASVALKRNPVTTLARINDLDPVFNRDDLYVFVIDSQTKTFIAHGANRKLLGTDVRTLRDPQGKPIGQDILSAIDGRDYGTAEYEWRNPVSGEKELKHTLLQRQGKFIIAVGYYSK